MVFLRRLQICTVAINRRPGSTDAEGFPVSGSSGSGPERTASLVLPDSPVREGAVSGAGASKFDASLAPAASHTLLTRSWLAIVCPHPAGPPASSHEVAQRAWDRPADAEAPSAANTNASDGMQSLGNPRSPQDRLDCKVDMEHQADSGGAVTVADQVEEPPPPYPNALPVWPS